MSGRLMGQRAAFWVTVGGVSILSQFLVELAADKFPSLGLARLVAYIHRGNNGGQA